MLKMDFCINTSYKHPIVYARPLSSKFHICCQHSLFA
uniref:Uncharacterized protein n=1 Tax=Arundo donax TaxID=35708 RepID=A0A0A9B5B8_ARUDO